MNNMDDNERQRFAEIVCIHANRRFGELLKELCKKANIKQDKLEEESEIYRTYLIERYPIQSGLTGGFKQSAISRVFKGQQIPTYSQVFIWTTILQRHLSEEDFPKDLRDDLYYLSGHVPPETIVDAYERRTKKSEESP